MVVRGIDISSHQGMGPWTSMPLERSQFVFVKATGGTTYINEYHDQQVAFARAHGRRVGHYHYAHELTMHAGQGEGPEAEAAHFLARANVQAGDLVALDIEDPAARGDLSNWALRWLGIVEQAIGNKPLMYSYPNYMDTRGLKIRALTRYPLWYAYYRTPPEDSPRPVAPLPWQEYAIWQWRGGNHIPGNAYDIDENMVYTTLDELYQFGAFPTKEFTHAEGFLSPIIDTFDWGKDSAGIIAERSIVVYNDEKQKWYRGTWRADTGVTWEEVG